MRDPPVLSISPEKIRFLITKAHRIATSGEEAEGDPEPESGAPMNPADQRAGAVSRGRSDVSAEVEFIGLMQSLNRDELIDLVALIWLGRGDCGLDGWPQLHAEAARSHNDRTVGQLLGTPFLADYLEQALLQFDQSPEAAGPARR